MTTWTDQRVALLTELWHQGVSAGLIGKKLDVSKNAVVGKAHRMGLAGRPSPIIRDGQVALTRQQRLARTTLASEVAVPPAPPESEGEVPLRRWACQYITGEKGRDFATYAEASRCSAPARTGSSYCTAHHRRTHVKPQPREIA